MRTVEPILIRCRGASKPLVLGVLFSLALAALAWPLMGTIGRVKSSAPSLHPSKSNPVLLGKQGENAGEFQQPRGVAFLRDGTFVVVDRAARVQHFSADNAPLSLWSMKDHALGNPKGLCGLPDGNMLVCDTHYGRVLKMTPDGDMLKTWGEPGKGPGQFVHPMGAALDVPRNRVFIVEYGDYVDRVQVYDLDGKWLAAFGSCGVKDGEFQRPSGIAVDEAGNVFIADACNHRIQKFDDNGRWLKTFGKEGSADGELRYPYDIAFSRADRLLYVAEFANHRVSVFDGDGNFVRRFGVAGYGPDDFANPWSIAADGRGRVIVSDTGNHRLKVFDMSAPATTLSAPAQLGTGER
ncbi:MAG: 6-bladed beta-propeller [Planctomycetota bacterium]